MHNHSSPHQAYFATLPKRDAVWSWYDIPESYLPLLQNSALVSCQVIRTLLVISMMLDGSPDCAGAG